MHVHQPNLTPREQDILRLVAQGLPNKEIAHRSGVCVSTVKQHVSHIMLKLQLRNRTQVAIFAERIAL